jgi:cytochrome c biogenesis protein CcdA
VSLLAILARQGMSAALGTFIPSIERWARVVQGAAGALIVLIGVYMTVSATF